MAFKFVKACMNCKSIKVKPDWNVGFAAGEVQVPTRIECLECGYKGQSIEVKVKLPEKSSKKEKK